MFCVHMNILTLFLLTNTFWNSELFFVIHPHSLIQKQFLNLLKNIENGEFIISLTNIENMNIILFVNKLKMGTFWEYGTFLRIVINIRKPRFFLGTSFWIPNNIRNLQTVSGNKVNLKTKKVNENQKGKYKK